MTALWLLALALIGSIQLGIWLGQVLLRLAERRPKRPGVVAEVARDRTVTDGHIRDLVGRAGVHRAAADRELDPADRWRQLALASAADSLAQSLALARSTVPAEVQRALAGESEGARWSSTQRHLVPP